MKTAIQPADLCVLGAYLVLMAGIGAYFVRFIRIDSDFLKGGNRVEWWVAGMASFMSGFSVWTFTGGAGFAYRHGVIGVFLMLLAVPAFFFGYAVFAVRWRRARVTTIVEYVRARFGEGTHKLFAWTTVPSQILFASVRLFALASFVSVALGVSVPHLIIVCGAVILLYTSLGGYWAICFTDMFQFMFLFPIAAVLAALSLTAAGGASGFAAQAPPGFFDPLSGEYGWLFLVAFTISQTIGYNNFANAQRYFCADTERSARKIALLCMALFTVGSFVFYVPALAARIVMPELGSTANGLREPAEAAYMAMGLRLLPPGLVGVLIAAMLASSMASLSATNHLVTGVVAKDLYQGYFDPRASGRRMLMVSRIASISIGLAMIAIALALTRGAKSVFTLLFVFESIFLVPVGLPLLYGLLTPRGPWWCALCAYAVGAATAIGVNVYVSGGVGHLNETHMIALPALTTTLAFFIPTLFWPASRSLTRRVRRLFTQLATPIDVEAELADAALSGRRQLALVGRVTTGMGLAALLLVSLPAGDRDRLIVVGYAIATTLLGVAFVLAGRSPGERSDMEHQPGDVRSAIER
jgi:solute:Na+ symporter, SSS family